MLTRNERVVSVLFRVVYSLIMEDDQTSLLSVHSITPSPDTLTSTLCSTYLPQLI